MDNCRVHKVAGVEEAIEARGARVEYLPAYSPDLNPIELSFSKFKAFLRKFAEQTIRALRRRVGACTDPFSCRMPQLLPACRLCANLTGIRCSATESAIFKLVNMAVSPLYRDQGRSSLTVCKTKHRKKYSGFLSNRSLVSTRQRS
jgi:hypothetical protein